MSRMCPTNVNISLEYDCSLSLLSLSLYLSLFLLLSTQSCRRTVEWKYLSNESLQHASLFARKMQREPEWLKKKVFQTTKRWKKKPKWYTHLQVNWSTFTGDKQMRAEEKIRKIQWKTEQKKKEAFISMFYLIQRKQSVTRIPWDGSARNERKWNVLVAWE